MVKTKAISYKFKPRLGEIAKSQAAIVKMKLQRQVIKEVVQGKSYEEIAADHAITEDEAVTMAKETLRRWATDLGQSATEARSLDLRRMDEMLAKLHPLVFPEPYIDGATGLVTIPRPDAVAMKLSLDIIDRRAKIYGYDAADKLSAEKNEILKRVYIGVATNSKGEIDI